jgi:hypothetical protein
MAIDGGIVCSALAKINWSKIIIILINYRLCKWRPTWNVVVRTVVSESKRDCSKASNMYIKLANIYIHIIWLKNWHCCHIKREARKREAQHHQTHTSQNAVVPPVRRVIVPSFILPSHCRFVRTCDEKKAFIVELDVGRSGWKLDHYQESLNSKNLAALSNCISFPPLDETQSIGKHGTRMVERSMSVTFLGI